MHVIKDLRALKGVRKTIYPSALGFDPEKRERRALTGLLGLTQFGVNLVTLAPGGMSSFRHWHAKEDECILVLEGEVVLITDQGETLLEAGMAAGFPAGESNGHHLVNRSNLPATYLEMGTRSTEESVSYSDVDLKIERSGGVNRMLHKSGEPY